MEPIKKVFVISRKDNKGPEKVKRRNETVQKLKNRYGKIMEIVDFDQN